MKTLEDEWYVVIKAYKFTIFKILGLSQLYCMSVQSLHTVYQIDDTAGSGKTETSTKKAGIS